MKNIEIDSKKLNLLKRTNYLLEETKSDYIIYEKERKLLLEFSKSSYANYNHWENVVNMLENIVDVNKNLKLKTSDFNYLKSLALLLRKEQNRKTDNIDNNTIYKIIDKNNNSYFFLTRHSAKKFIEDNKSLFDNTSIIVINNKNDELQHLLQLIERNF